MDAVDEVKNRLNIEDVIGEYVELKRSGRNYKGLSPFNAEKSPSFMVSPDKQIWHDFSSGKGGSMFTFVMEMEGLEFRGALELLARKAGVDLEQFRGQGSSKTRELKERLLEVNEWAAKFYQKQLVSNRTALEYVLGKRAFTKETTLAWRLGYAPNTGRALYEFLMKKKFTQDEIKRAGLGTQRARGFGDMFRGRIMVPLCDSQGNVIGFTARILVDDPEAPKYINTPQTLLYDKGRHVFGLHHAKESIRKNKFAVIAEGNLDVIASYQADVRNVVATAGTALTEMQLKTLSRFTDDIRAAFDQDRAGLAATERAIPIAQKVGVQLSVITVPSGKDPDELVRQDPQAWRDVITQPAYAVDWLMAQYAGQLDLTTASGKKQLTDIALATIRRLQDPVEQEHYLGKLAKLSNTSIDALQRKLKGIPEAAPRRRKKPVEAKDRSAIVESPTYNLVQDHLLALSMGHPRWRLELADLPPELFSDEHRQAVWQYLLTHPSPDNKQAIAKDLHAQEDYVKILVLQFEELYQDLDGGGVQDAFHTLKRRAIHAYVEHQKRLISHQLSMADGPELQALLEKDKILNNLLNNYKD